MRVIIGILILIIFNSFQVFAFPSEQLRELWDFPINTVKYKTVKKYYQGSVNVEEVYYQSREFMGNPVQIFGYYCYPPVKNKKLPAILISHGGGGSANLANTINWAKHGYAVLAIDLPGHGEQRLNSRSTGPDMDVSALLCTRPDPSYNYLIHAVAAARNGITFLSQRKEVDPERIGMVGLSWGGVITLLTNGQDTRLKTAVNVFGAGYIPEGCTWQRRFNNKTSQELNEWYSFIDPKNFLKTQHAPILFITGTNDHCYYLPTFQKSYEEVTVPKKIVLIPNLRHRFPPYMQNIVLSWLDNKLKHSGSFPKVEILPLFKKGEDKIIVQAAAKTCSEVTKVTLYYTPGEPSRWTRRKWESIEAYYEDGIYYFAIPASLIKPEMMFYVTVRDNKGSVASSMIRSILRVKTLNDNETFALSSPIKKINKHGAPYQIMGWKNDLPFKLQFLRNKNIYSMSAIQPN
jgi:cephalosporin-C deacetylase-like acetyl esterase